jgi:hypothetical protein
MKALGWVAGAVVLVLTAIVVYVLMNSAALLERAIERYGTRYLGVQVTVDEVEVALTEGGATVRGLQVDNPRGFSGPPAMRMAEIRIGLDMGATSSALLVLDAVAIDGAEVTALLRRQESNLQQILDHLNAQIAAHGRAEQTRVASEVKLIIDRFDFTRATAAVESDVLGRATVDLPPVHLTGVGREQGGAAIGQVLRQLLEPIFRSVLSAAAARGVDLPGARRRADEQVDRALERFIDRQRSEE